MKPRPSVRLGSAFPALLAITLISAFSMCGAAAQRLQSYRQRTAPAPSWRLPRPLSQSRLQDLPIQRLLPEQLEAWQSQTVRALNNGARPPAPPPTNPQFIDLTTNPRPPQIGSSSLCQEIHPAWAWDQQSIYFTSNNVNAIASYGTTAPLGDSPFHVYRMSSEGAFIQQVTGLAGDEVVNDQRFPAISHALTKLAYVHRPRLSEPFQLYVLDLQSGSRIQLTGINVLNNPLNADIVSVERPSWSPGDTTIAFAARRKSVSGDVRNIFVVDVVSGVVRQLTSGTPANGVESIDPVYHPVATTNRIAFAANAGGIAANGDLVYVANPLQDLRRDGTVNDINHNLFTIPATGATALNPIAQLTTNVADDVEPAYQTVTNGVATFANFIAWSSLGRLPDGAAPTRNTFDIYYSNGGIESLFNVPIRLFTPDSTGAALPDHNSDERSPTWSSGLPTSKPTQRLVFSSNRQNNVNNLPAPLVSLTDTDLWGAELIDITPPALLTMDDARADLVAATGTYAGQDLSFLQGEILHIANAALPNRGRRTGDPGDTMFFYANLRDLQYGIESVWLQIKDPDGPATDSQGVNHKLFNIPAVIGGGTTSSTYVIRRQNDGSISDPATHFIHLPFETDAQGISVSDYSYYDRPTTIDAAMLAVPTHLASKNPGVDDVGAWSGNSATGLPLTTQWLRLTDDGAGADARANDGVFSAQWVTPQAGSDFYVDLIAYDNAFNPLNPAQQRNWIIYDNIWGFSTQQFSSLSPVLVVDDHGAGQKWPRGLNGSFRRFPTYRLGTEADVTSRPLDFWPKEFARNTVNPIPDPLSSIAGNPNQAYPIIGGTQQAETYDFLNGDLFSGNTRIGYDFINWLGNGSLRAYRYDLWRILARGPLQASVIADYQPVKDDQPTDITGATTIQRAVPRRAVLWNAPYMGDIFLGSGSILDQATQTLLTNYKSAAGRLVVAGGDILWSLTVDGSLTNLPFVRNVLGASYGADGGPAGTGFTPTGTAIANAVLRDVGPNVGFTSRGVDDTTAGRLPTLLDQFDIDPFGISAYFPGGWDGNLNHNGGASLGNAARSVGDGVPFEQQDIIGATQAGWQDVIPGKMIGNDDPATGSKTVFMSFSLASMGRRVFAALDDAAVPDPPLPEARLVSLNYKAKMSHAMFCWMFSADLVGRVSNLNGGGSVSGALVEAFQGGRVGTALTRPDGTFTIRGLPIGSWSIRVTAPGFLGFFKATGSGAHGLGQGSLDVLLSPASPGSISGTVLDQDNQPVPGTNIKATLQASPLYTGAREFTAVTLPDGSYVIPNTPTGSYTVIVDNPLPNRFINPTAQFSSPVLVNPGQNTPGINFLLQGQAGPLTVQVFEQLADGTRGAPVDGAEVAVLNKVGALRAGFTAVTGAKGVAGQVIFSASDPNADVALDVPPGPGTVTVFKLGRQEGVAAIRIPQMNTVEVLLATAPPRSLYGEVKRKIDGQDITAADLGVPVVFGLLRRSSQLPVGLTATAFAPAATVPVRHHYTFSAQEGLFTVALTGHPNWLDVKVDASIASSGNSVAPLIELVGRDGVVSGQVNEDNGSGGVGKPLDKVTVEFKALVGVDTGKIVSTVLTDAAGRFTTGATIASTRYDVTFRRFGHITQIVRDVFVAGPKDLGTILMVREPRGRLYGVTRRTTDGLVRSPVTIVFQPVLGVPADARTVTSGAVITEGTPDGSPINYTIGSTNIANEDLPQGDYQVRVTGDPRFLPYSSTVTVDGGAEKRFDIDLQPAPGVLTGLVRERNADGSPGLPVEAATVRILRGTALQATLTTDVAGRYTTAGALPGGAYNIQVSAFGFFDGAGTVVVEGPTTAGDILISRVAPSIVTGSVRSSVDAAFIPDVNINVFTTSGQATAVPAAVSVGTALPGVVPAANFRFPQLPPGNYILRAAKAGYRGADGRAFAERTLTVNPGVNVNGVSFVLVPRHVFGKGLLLISLPEDFGGEDLASVLSQNPATFKSAFYQTDATRYAIYNEADASTLPPGRGMFVRFPATTAFARQGAAIPAVPFFQPLRSGWNLIGSVRAQRIEWLRVRVVTPDRPAPLTLQEAMDAGIVQNGLMGYQDGYFRSDYLEPFAGYFVRAFQECTLIIPVDNSVVQSKGTSPNGPGVRSAMPSRMGAAPSGIVEQATVAPRGWFQSPAPATVKAIRKADRDLGRLPRRERASSRRKVG